MFIEVQHPQSRPCLHMQMELKVHNLHVGSSQDLEFHLGSGPLVESRVWRLALRNRQGYEVLVPEM